MHTDKLARARMPTAPRRPSFELGLSLCVGLVLPLAGCGGGGGGGGGGAGTDTGTAGITAPPSTNGTVTPSTNPPDYFPMAVGDRWVYADSVDGAAPLRTTFRVMGTQNAGGTPALLAQADDGGATREELYVRSSTGISRIPAESADAVTRAVGPVLVLRLPVQAGDTYTAVDRAIAACYDFDSDGVLDPLTVQSSATVIGFETLDTAMGSMPGVAHVRTVLTQTTTLSGNGAVVTVRSTTDDWYAPGLGPLRKLTLTEANGITERSDSTVQAFRVGNAPSESVPPTVSQIGPADGSAQAPTAQLRVVYSEPMDRSSGSVLQLLAPDGTAVVADIVWDDDRTARLVPSATLLSGRYTARATTAAQDLAGNPLAAARVWSFSVAGP
jgi:hypothetical protein